MTDAQLQFVIPTYRLRDVGETVEAYDANFERSGQTAPIVVFDDSSVANHDKYFSVLACLIHEPAAHWCFGFGGSVAA